MDRKRVVAVVAVVGVCTAGYCAYKVFSSQAHNHANCEASSLDHPVGEDIGTCDDRGCSERPRGEVVVNEVNVDGHQEETARRGHGDVTGEKECSDEDERNDARESGTSARADSEGPAAVTDVEGGDACMESERVERGVRADCSTDARTPVLKELLLATEEHGLDEELMSALLESTGGALTEVLVSNIVSLAPSLHMEIVTIQVEYFLEGAAVKLKDVAFAIPQRVPLNAFVAFVVEATLIARPGQRKLSKKQRRAARLERAGATVPSQLAGATVEVTFPSGQRDLVHAGFCASEFGACSIDVQFPGCDVSLLQKPLPEPMLPGRLPQTLAVSPVHRYVSCLDHLFDLIFFAAFPTGADGWCEELGEVLRAMELGLEEFSRMFEGQLGALMRTSGEALDEMLGPMREHLSNAMNDRDLNALGRLHQTVYQFFELAMFPLPETFRTAIHRFDAVKCARSNQDLITAATVDLCDAMEGYLSHVSALLGGPRDDRELAAVYTTMQALKAHLAQGSVPPSAFHSLRPSPLASLIHGSIVEKPAWRVSFLPTFPFEMIVSGTADARVDHLSEGLFGEACTVGVSGSVMGFPLHNGEGAIDVITGLLRAGFGYVIGSNRIMGLLAMNRASLFLDKPLCLSSSTSPSLRKVVHRRKDVARVLRNKDIEHEISLRINSDVAGALDNLRRHHPHSWVNSTLEEVWLKMIERGLMVVLELWLGNVMIAADFGHPVGASFYVATRFFDPAHKTLQPGFLLAFVEAKYLRSLGFGILDFGGTDASPMMSYKAYVAEIFPGPLFFPPFRVLREQSALPIPSGVAVAHVGEDALLEL